MPKSLDPVFANRRKMIWSMLEKDQQVSHAAVVDACLNAKMPAMFSSELSKIRKLRLLGVVDGWRLPDIVIRDLVFQQNRGRDVSAFINKINSIKTEPFEPKLVKEFLSGEVRKKAPADGLTTGQKAAQTRLANLERAKEADEKKAATEAQKPVTEPAVKSKPKPKKKVTRKSRAAPAASTALAKPDVLPAVKTWTGPANPALTVEQKLRLRQLIATLPAGEGHLAAINLRPDPATGQWRVVTLERSVKEVFHDLG